MYAPLPGAVSARSLLVARLGWRGLFIITGVAGLLWLVPWALGRLTRRRVVVVRAEKSNGVAGPHSESASAGGRIGILPHGNGNGDGTAADDESSGVLHK